MHHHHPHGHPPQTEPTPEAQTACPPQPEAAPSPGVAAEAVAQAAAAFEAAIPETSQPQPPSPEEQLREAQQKADEHRDAWLRAKAEGENIRRRAQEDIAKAHKFAVERFAGDLLAVKDSLEAALSNQNQTVEALRDGVELTLKQLVAAFDKSGLKELNPAGEKFDPHFHQAISMVESEQEANTVVTVLQKGYLIAERVLRPALVMVAKAKPAPEAAAPSGAPPSPPPAA